MKVNFLQECYLETSPSENCTGEICCTLPAIHTGKISFILMHSCFKLRTVRHLSMGLTLNPYIYIRPLTCSVLEQLDHLGEHYPSLASTRHTFSHAPKWGSNLGRKGEVCMVLIVSTHSELLL